MCLLLLHGSHCASHCFSLSPISRFFLSNGLSLPTSLAGLAVSELGETETSLEGLHSAVVEVSDYKCRTVVALIVLCCLLC